MKYNNIIYKIGTLSLMFLAFSTSLNAQNSNKKAKVQPKTVKIQLLDNDGIAVPYAEVVVGEGRQHQQTDKMGYVSVDVTPETFVTFSEPGFERKVVSAGSLPVNGVVNIEKSLLYKSESDVIPMPYDEITKRNATGDYIVITSEDLKRYPTSDLRNALSALVPGLIITEYDGSTGTNAEENNGNYRQFSKVGESIRGGGPIYIIDDVPIDITEMPLDPEEVETVTVVKDMIGKSMYGPRAANGIIYIKTKKGKANDRVLTVNMEKGVQVMDRFQSTATGAEYATINNLARVNSGLDPLYTTDDIKLYEQNYTSDINAKQDIFHPSNDFIGMMFKDTKTYQRVNVSSTGGNDHARYYAYVGYTGDGDNFALGSPANYNRINARSNLSMKLNDIVSVDVGVFAGMTIRKSPNYKYSSEDVQDFNHAILHARTVNPIAFPIYMPVGNEEETGILNYGMTNSYKENPIGNMVGSGYYTERGRTGNVNTAINLDLSAILPGLKSRSFINFMVYNQARIGKNERYPGYSATQNFDDLGNPTDTTFTVLQDVVVASSESKLHDYYYQHISGYQQFSYDRTFGDHQVSANLMYYLSEFTRNGIENPYREQNASFNAAYAYKNRYAFAASVTYAGTASLIGKNQYQFFPTVGGSWVISEENFMKDSGVFDFLKLRAEVGQLGYQTNKPSTFLYENKWSVGGGAGYGAYTTDRWQGSQTGISSYSTGYNKWKNPDLNWEIIKEYSIGLDATLLDRSLTFTANYYSSLHDGQWGSYVKLPLMSGLLASPTVDVNATKYYGAELYARYTNNIGDFGYSIAGSVLLPRTKRVRYDEANYREDYLKREGQSADLIYGYTYDGVYASDAEAQSAVQYFDQTLQAGDFKYVDMNKDGKIDNLDVSPIGNSAPRAYYTINLAFSYKKFDLTIVADGKAGYDLLKNDGYGYYQGGWGNNNYSKYIVDNYKTNYPRLTYYKVNNNFQTSNYWMQKGDYFKIQNIELAYNLSSKGLKKINLNQVRIFARAANVATISGVKDVDPESVNSGFYFYPLNRTFTGGFNLTF